MVETACAAAAPSECNQIQDGIASFFWRGPKVFAALPREVNASSRNTATNVNISQGAAGVTVR
jgi:hypothetical protein